VVSALSVSGFASERFVFEGFLPRHPSKRRDLLAQLCRQERTVVFYESPHRIVESLKDCIQAWGPKHEAVIARELTKMHEQVMRNNLENLLEDVQKNVRGEYCVVVAPRTKAEQRKIKREFVRAVQLDQNENQSSSSGGHELLISSNSGHS